MSEFGDKLKARTKAFALRIIRMSSAMPRTSPGRVLGDQVLRAATSVGANYREAFRARSQAEFIAKIGDCLREIEETDYWLELIAESKLLPKWETCRNSQRSRRINWDLRLGKEVESQQF